MMHGPINIRCNSVIYVFLYIFRLFLVVFFFFFFSSCSPACGRILRLVMYQSSSTIFFHSRRSLTVVNPFFIPIINLLRPSLTWSSSISLLPALCCSLFWRSLVFACFQHNDKVFFGVFCFKPDIISLFHYILYLPICFIPHRSPYASVCFPYILPFKHLGCGSSFCGHFPDL